MSSQPFPLLPPIQPPASGTSGTELVLDEPPFDVDLIPPRAPGPLTSREVQREEQAFGRVVSRQIVPAGPQGGMTKIANRAATLRQELYLVVTRDELREVVKAILKEAKKGDMSAAKLILDRLLGMPVAPDFLETITEIKSVVSRMAPPGR